MQVLQIVREFIISFPWNLTIIFCLTLGLAPFVPIPHILEKLKMLSEGALIRPIDWFDLLLHGTPWIFLILKIVLTIQGENTEK